MQHIFTTLEIPSNGYGLFEFTHDLDAFFARLSPRAHQREIMLHLIGEA